uniref:Uncharacterized protein n=1 Tax=Tanacetum cinerariifolium TaxID=118510 RepID=A0A6L2NG15_TANCI|nr:hypothetical protein [Tanacetum cinerariifolium]
MLEFEAYMTYHAYATGEKTPKPKFTKKKVDSESSPKTKRTQASKGKRIKTSTKGDKPVKMQQSITKSKGLTVLSEAALYEANQMNTNERAGDKPEVLDVPEYQSESKEESWTFSQGEDNEHDNDDDIYEHDSANDNDDQENDSGETKSDDDEDDFVYPNMSTCNADDHEEEDEEEKANDDNEVSSDKKVSTPPDYEISDEEDNQVDDDKVMGGEQEDKEDEELVSSLEFKLSKLKKTNQFAKYVSSISGLVDNYLGFKMKDAVNVAVQLQSNKFREDAQAKNDEFLKQINSNIKAIIKDQVKAQVSKILPKVKKSDVLKNLNNALIESYNLGKDIFALYGDVVTLKRGHDDQEKDEEPSAGSNRRTKRRRSGKEESSKEATQKESKSTSFSKEPFHQEFNTRNDVVSPVRELSQASDTQSSLNEFLATPIDFSAFLINQLKIHNLTQDVLTGPTYDLMNGAYKGPKHQKFYGYATNMETSNDVYSRHMIIVVTSLKIMEFFGYKHLEEIIIRTQDDQLYKFQEGDFKRLCRQHIKDMLLLLVQGKLTNLNLDEYFALNVGLRYGVLAKEKIEQIDNQRARVMINSIDKKLRDRRLMRCLEKFVGGRPYRGYLRLL